MRKSLRIMGVPHSPMSYGRPFLRRGIKDTFEIYGFKAEMILGAGYYPLPSFFARLNPVHAAFLSCKFRKPI